MQLAAADSFKIPLWTRKTEEEDNSDGDDVSEASESVKCTSTQVRLAMSGNTY